MLLLALELDARRDAVARHLEGLLVRPRGHVLVVVAHQVGAQQQEGVGRHLKTIVPHYLTVSCLEPDYEGS